MKHRILDHATVAQMFNDDPLEQGRSHAGVPYALRVDDDDRTACTDAKAGCFAALYAPRAEQQTFALEQRREQPVQLSTRLIRRTKAADTHENVA